MGMASLPRTTWRELSPFLLCFADLCSPFRSCSRSITFDVFCWFFLVTFLRVFCLVLVVTDFLLALDFDLLLAAVASALDDVDLLPAVVLDFRAAATVALAGCAVVIAPRAELFVLRGAPRAAPRPVFLWSELPWCSSSDVFTASSVSLTSGASDLNALLRPLPFEGPVEFVLRVWPGLASFEL